MAIRIMTKVRNSGNSLLALIPSKTCEAFDIKDKDILVVDIIKRHRPNNDKFESRDYSQIASVEQTDEE